MHEYVCVFPVERKSCFCHFFVLGATSNKGFKPTSRHKPASLAFILLFLLLLPSLICYDAVFIVALTCHLQPHLPTYVDILFRVRSNLHADCDVHCGILDWLLECAHLTAAFLRNITPHLLILDITTQQQGFRNCHSDGDIIISLKEAINLWILLCITNLWF